MRDELDSQEPQLERDSSFVRELFEFMLQNKKWWLVPIVVVMALFAGLLILGGTGAAPFIYTLF
jgi:hypothetical protein